MTHDEDNLIFTSDIKDIQNDRRTFMKGAAVTGLMSVLGQQTAVAQSQNQNERAAMQAGVVQPGRPPRKPSLDLRNPESFQYIGDATKVVMDHFKGINQRNIQMIADTLHFPFGSFEGVDVVATKTREDLIADAPASLNMTTNPERFTDHDGYINPGTYDVFDGLQVYNSDPVQVSIAMSYDRYSPSGSKLLRCDGIYAVTNNDGRWAIQAASTIFTPGDQVGLEFPDAVQAAFRLRQRHTQGYQLAYEPDVWANVRQLGPNMGINAGRDNEYGFTQAPPFKNGVKNRLSLFNYTQEQLDRIKIDFPLARERWKALNMGNWGFDYGGSKPARIIHASVNKVHVYQGTTRYTAGGEFISNTMEMDVITLVQDRWGIAGILGNMLVRDRANDVANIKL